MNILTFNNGSSSLKYNLFNFSNNHIDLILEKSKDEIKFDQLENITIEIFNEINNFLKENNITLDAIGFRIVHGGEKYTNPIIIDHEILNEIINLKALAPLHNEISSKLILLAKKNFLNIPIIAVFDTGFHKNIPKIASTYALPNELIEKYKIKRYGFHGIAHKSVFNKLTKLTTKYDKTIICHLGSGSSICAVKNGVSIDTSMGFSPLEGLIMSSRSGDIDPGIILYLINYCNFSSNEINHILNNKSGLLGLSGISKDFRTLETAANSGNKNAEFAIDCFVYRIIKYIGAYFVTLGGLDNLIFSGGIGENSRLVHKKICEYLTCLNIKLANNYSDSLISDNSSKVSVWIIKVEENLEIAKNCYSLIKKPSF